MIPDAITAAHVRAALALIDRDGVPSRRRGRSYALVHEGRRYPPKYTLALAAKLATGRELDPDTHGGGAETNTFLRRRGFTVVRIDAGSPTPTSTTVRVARAFLDLGVRQKAYRSMPQGKADAFHDLVTARFLRDPQAYRARIQALVRTAVESHARVVVLPAYACQAHADVPLDAYGVPEAPLVLAGGLDERGEFATAFRDGVPAERFTDRRVSWLGADGFSVMAAISSTVGQLIETRHQPPIPSGDHPPDPGLPVLVTDMGHAQYSSRYDFNTLRCVARDVAARSGMPAAVVLSSWMWSTRGIRPAWCHPPERVQCRRLVHGPDVLDLCEVQLGTAAPAAAETA